MCGILGFVGADNISDSLFTASIEQLAHRGPDARGHFRDDGIALGHLRLSIIDLSNAANQPMHSHCGRYVMVYNGEVYNFKELHQQLSLVNPDFAARTQSDTEIILEAFATWHTDFVNRLNGMFAIAIWDTLEKKLYLFRDRLGIKPIYYYRSQDSFAFASELKVLKNNPNIRNHTSINYIAINQFLHLGYIPAPESIFNEIRKFPAGCYGIWDKDNFTITPFWNPAGKINQKTKLKTCGEYLNELKSLLESSVKFRLMADVPFGTFLSGGIDSSIVTAVAQSVHSRAVNTFSIGFWDQAFDESGYARKVSEYLGTNHHSIRVTEADALEWMPQLTGIYDEPYADSSAIPTLLVSKMARKHVTMTLSGDGGDELFMGYGAYRWAERLKHPAMTLMKWPASELLKHGPLKYRRAAGLFENIPASQLKSHIFSQEQYLFSRKGIKGILNPEFYRPFELDETFIGMVSSLSASEQQAFFDLTYYLPDDLLAKVDRASMFFGLETRVPLLDYRLVEWALNLPPQFKNRKGESKWLLKQLLYQYVPKSLFDRPKRGFAIPLQNWLRKDLKDFAMDYLNTQAVKDVGILNPEAVRTLLDAFYQKNQTYLYNKVWQLLVLQKWFIENRV
jgi:asparagine synthase (glutamine-hydrolysing)